MLKAEGEEESHRKMDEWNQEYEQIGVEDAQDRNLWKNKISVKNLLFQVEGKTTVTQENSK